MLYHREHQYGCLKRPEHRWHVLLVSFTLYPLVIHTQHLNNTLSSIFTYECKPQHGFMLVCFFFLNHPMYLLSMDFSLSLFYIPSFNFNLWLSVYLGDWSLIAPQFPSLAPLSFFSFYLFSLHGSPTYLCFCVVVDCSVFQTGKVTQHHRDKQI